jgi:hypothetical protein
MRFISLASKDMELPLDDKSTVFKATKNFLLKAIKSIDIA